MFRRDSRIRFEGVVHETVDPSILRYGGKIDATDVIIHHFHELKGKENLREKQLQYLRLCEKSLGQSSRTPKTYYDMGIICRYMLKDLPKAIAHQKKALELNPAFEAARLELAISYHLEGNSKAAAREVTILLKQNPDCAPALHLCGIMLERQGRIERAITCYRQAAERNPNLIDTRINLGTLLFKKGEYERARREWLTAHKLNPSNTRVLLNLGALELRDGRYDSAEGFFEKALEKSPDNAPLWNNMGVLHASRGRDREALEAFGKAVKLNPSFADARRNLEALQNKKAVTV
jgi:tetratricopeptide (TPR) repeat protein